MKDLFSVRQFSELTGVDASRLRFWDDIGVFSPVMRDPENNYRYYSLSQILALNFVSVLSDLDIPLKTIAELRKKRDPEAFLRILEKKEREMDMELRALRQRSSIIHARQELIRYGLRVSDDHITVLRRDEKNILMWPRNEYEDENDTFIKPLASFVSKAEMHYVNLSFPVGGYWDNLESFKAGPGRPDHFFSIDPTGTHIRKEGKYLVGFARGNYGEMGDLPQRMDAYAKENAIGVSGPVYVMYLHDEICSQEPSLYFAQAIIAVSGSRRKKEYAPINASVAARRVKS